MSQNLWVHKVLYINSQEQVGSNSFLFAYALVPHCRHQLPAPTAQGYTSHLFPRQTPETKDQEGEKGVSTPKPAFHSLELSLRHLLCLGRLSIAIRPSSGRPLPPQGSRSQLWTSTDTADPKYIQELLACSPPTPCRPPCGGSSAFPDSYN